MLVRFRSLRSARWLSSLLLSLLLLTSVAHATADTQSARGPAFDFAIDVQADPETVAQGGSFTVTLTVTNNGPSPSPTGIATCPIPTGASFEDADSTSGQVTPPNGAGGQVTVMFDSLAPDDTVEITINLTAEADPGEMIEGAASVAPAGGIGDADPDNDNGEFVVIVADGSVGDLTLELTPEDDVAGSDSLFAYYVDVTNNSEESPVQGVVITASVPPGTVFAESSSFDGDCFEPDLGEEGEVVCTVDELGPGETTTVEIVVLVVADPGEIITFDASVESASEDANPDDNEDFADVDVIPSEEVSLDWDEPDFSSATELPPPRNLVLVESNARWDRTIHPTPSGLVAVEAGTPAARATLIGFNIYRATGPGTPLTPANLLMSVPPTVTIIPAPASPAGTFFVVTAVYDQGESMPTNEVTANVMAATVSSLKVKGPKITAVGMGFSPDVQVFVDGIPFAAAAKVKKQNTKVIQKGNLITGDTLTTYLRMHPSVVVSFRNNNGGVVQVRNPM